MHSYADALDFWYGRVDYEKRPIQPGDLKLDRMRLLLRLLGDPHHRLRIIHVAGTKGKGSTCAMLSSVLRAAGYGTGLFTSPHLEDVRERVQVDDTPITPDELLARMREIEVASRQMEALDPAWKPTFFEIGTALGFLHFDCRRVDWAIVEVGLGGRWDSTNVCLPKLCVLTNISYDHMAFLGATLELIAGEKAGIIKPRVPVVSTAQAQEAMAVFAATAAMLRAPFRQYGTDFHLSPFKPALAGAHQQVNAAGVVAAVAELRKLGATIPDAAIEKGLKDVRWPARMEKVREKPVVVLDCAHNEESARALVETMRSVFPVKGTRRLVVAISSDKQVKETLAVLTAYFPVVYATQYANNPRRTPPETVAAYVREANPQAIVTAYATAKDAVEAALKEAGPDDAVVVTGSVFLAGEVRGMFKGEK